MKIQDKVIDYFKKQGFNCISQQGLPEVIAWSPLRQANGKPMQIPTVFKQSEKKQIIVPFIVVGVTYKKPTKKEMKIVERLIGTMFSSLAIARMNGKKLEFDIMSMEEIENGRTTGYIG